MKKICILQNSMTFGGTDTFVINLCTGLVKDGNEVTVILSVDSKDAIRVSELNRTGVRVLRTCSLQHGIKSKLKHLYLLYKELKKNKYDIFQSNIDLFNGPQMLVAWLARVPIRECHSHNSEQGRELNEGRSFAVRSYQYIMRWLCWNFSNRRCGCSEAALNFLFKDEWKKDPRARVVHNGVYFDQYRKKFDIVAKRKKLGIKKKKVICTVGRISFQKNSEFLIDIFHELTQIRDDIELVWCGDGEEDKIREKISQYAIGDRIHLLGSRNDIPEILICSDAFLLPSRFEGLGIVLIEAQAAGLPCVISDVIPSEVDCGLCVSLSLHESAGIWAKRLSDVLDKKIDLNLNEIKLSRYSVENMVKEMEEVFSNE